MSNSKSKVKIADSREFLMRHGMKEKLIMKLDEPQINDLIAFAMDHINVSNLDNLLIQLASMEVRGKAGAIKLAANGIGTVIQLKNLNPDQIKQLVDELEAEKDIALVSREIKRMLIESQQEKLYFRTDGVKGEYYLTRNDHLHRNKDY